MLLDSGLQYNTIALHRSAISRYHRGIDGVRIGEVQDVSDFLKGVFNVNPPTKILIPAWDLSLVLSVLAAPPFAPFSELDLKMLTFKTVFLVAITSARRVSELHALGRGSPFTRFENHAVCLNALPGFLPKTANQQFLGREIVLPCFCGQIPQLCVRCILQHYVNETEKLENCSTDHLFVAFGGGIVGKSVVSRTIAGWLVRVIRMAYEIKEMPEPKVRAHSTRSVATSWGLFQKASIEQIMHAADWRSQSTFIKHYKLHIWKQERAQFGESVLQSCT
jgi:hypothetical protein